MLHQNFNISTVTRWRNTCKLVSVGLFHQKSHFSQISQGNSVSEAPTSKDLAYSKRANISKLKPWHRSILMNEPPPGDEFEWQKQPSAMRRRFAKYGKMSGIDPGVCWPSKEELKEKIAEEELWTAPNIFENLQEIKEKKEAEMRRRAERIAEVDKNITKYGKQIKEYRNKLIAKQNAIEESKQRKLKKIQEIRDSLGYQVDAKDPRFIALYEKKLEEEQEQTEKEDKKEKRKALKAGVPFVKKSKTDSETVDSEESL